MGKNFYESIPKTNTSCELICNDDEDCDAVVDIAGKCLLYKNDLGNNYGNYYSPGNVDTYIKVDASGVEHVKFIAEALLRNIDAVIRIAETIKGLEGSGGSGGTGGSETSTETSPETSNDNSASESQNNEHETQSETMVVTNHNRYLLYLLLLFILLIIIIHLSLK